MKDSTATSRRRAALLVALSLVFGLGGWLLVRDSSPERTDVGSDRPVEVGGAGGGPRPMLEGGAPSRGSVRAIGSEARGPTGQAARLARETDDELPTFDVEWPSIRVVGPGGAIVRSAEVQLRDRDEMLRGEVRDGRVYLPRGPRPDSTLSGVEMEVTAPVAADPRILLAPTNPEPFAAGSTTVTVELPRASAIEGRVVGPDGGGVAGVRVTANVGRTGPLDVWWSCSHGSVVTDANGAFRISSLAERPYDLEVESTDRWVPEETSTSVVAATPPTQVVVRVSASLPVPIRIVDFDGLPVPGATVSARPRARRLVEEVALSDAQGVAVVHLVAREEGESVRVVPPLERRDLFGAFQSGIRAGGHTVQLARKLSISGTVRGPDGRPVADVRVEYAGPASDHHLVKGAADGTFIVEGLETGTFRLRATARYDLRGIDEGDPSRLGPWVTAEAGDRDVELPFTPGVTVRVFVGDDRAGGFGVGDATLSWASLGGQTCSCEVPLEGDAYMVPHLVEGASYTLFKTGWSRGDPPFFETFVARAGVEVTIQSRTRVDVNGRVTLAPGSGRRQFLVVAVVSGVMLLQEQVVGESKFTLRGLPVLPERVMLMGVDSGAQLLDSVPVTRADHVIELRAP